VRRAFAGGGIVMREQTPPPSATVKRAAALALGLVLATPLVWLALVRWELGGGSGHENDITVSFEEDSGGRDQLLAESQAAADGRAIPQDSDESFLRRDLPVKVTRKFYPAVRKGTRVHDPVMYSRLPSDMNKRVKFLEHPDGSWQLRTNSLGMRGDAEPLEPKPSLRVVVTGDSHTEGVCSNSENLSNQLALRLRAAGIEDAEVLNSGGSGYDIYNYVGVVRARAELQPDLYVVIVFGGNDFQGSMGLQRFFHRRGGTKNRPWNSREMLQKHDAAKGLLAQELFQAFYFMNNPSEEVIALRTATAACMEMMRSAAEAGARVLFVYLPPALAGQPELMAEVRDATIADLGLPPDCIEISNRLADRWLQALRERELPVLDLRPAFAAADERL
jgi:lysophospholipase L1-like esterase